MCSILITNKAIDQDIEQVNRYLKLRGPDATNVYQQEGITFVHNLLSMTGEFTPHDPRLGRLARFLCVVARVCATGNAGSSSTHKKRRSLGPPFSCLHRLVAMQGLDLSRADIISSQLTTLADDVVAYALPLAQCGHAGTL